MLTAHVDDASFQAYFQQLRKRLGNLEPVMEAIGHTLETRVRERFETRTDPDGKAWAPWAESTLASYPFPGTPAAATEGPGNGRLLDRYGTMLDLLSHDATSNSVRIGFAHEYATYHEFGTERMPRRGLLYSDPETGELGEEDEAAVLEVLSDWINDLARG